MDKGARLERLEEEEAHISGQLESLGVNVKQMTEGNLRVAEAIEAATMVELSTKNLALIENGTRILTQIKHAKERIDKGVGHLCERCGEEILKERIEALSSATMCCRCARINAAGCNGNGNSRGRKR